MISAASSSLGLSSEPDQAMSNENVTEKSKKLKEIFHRLLKPYHITCHTQLIYLLTKQWRNVINFNVAEGCFALRLSADKKAAEFSELGSKISTKVCWWNDGEGCQLDSGENSYLLCFSHAITYLQQIDASETLYSAKKFCKWKPPSREAETTASLYPEILQKRQIVSGSDVRFEIANAFTSLVTLMEPRISRWDALIDMDMKWRTKISNYIGLQCVNINGALFSFEQSSGSFLFKRPDDSTWRRVCNFRESPCFSLAHDCSSKCVTHLLMGKHWKDFIKTKVCELTGVTSLKDISVNKKLALISKIRKFKFNRLEIVPSYLFLIAHIRMQRLEVKFRNALYQLCDNYAEDCCNPFSRDPGKSCPLCHYRRRYTACLYYLPVVNKYWTTLITHLDPRFGSFDLDKVSGGRVDPAKANRQLLHKTECPTPEEASVWTSGYFLYVLTHAYICGRTVEFINAAVAFSWGAWKAVNVLAAKKDFRIVRTLELVGTRPDNYTLYFDPNEGSTPGSQHFQSVVYKVKVDELTYIGETSIGSTRRTRKLPLYHYEKEQSSCGVILQRLKEKNVDFSDFQLPSVCIGECEDTKTSGYLAETMALLTFCAKWDLLRKYDDKIVNKFLSCTSLSPKWFEEVQYFLAKLMGGETIKIVLGEKFEKDGDLFPQMMT